MDDPITVFKQTLAEVESHWDELTGEQQQGIHESLRDFQAHVREETPFGRRTRLVAAVDTITAEVPVFGVTISQQPSATWRTRLVEVQEDQLGELLNLSDLVLQLPVGGRAEPTHQYRRPAQAAVRVLQQLEQAWPDLGEDTRQKVGAVLMVLQRGLEHATTDPRRGRTIQGFLDGLSETSPVHPLVEPVLASSRLPYRGGRPVGRAAVRPILEALAQHPGLPRGVVQRGTGEGGGTGKGFVTAPGPPSLGAGPPPGMPAPIDALPTMAEALGPAEALAVDYYTAVNFPSVLYGPDYTLEQPAPLTVQLTIQQPEQTVASERVEVVFEDREQPEPIEVILSAEGFREVTGDNTRTILAYPKRDSQVAVFLLLPLPQTRGSQRIVLDFRHKERLIGCASFETFVARDRAELGRRERLEVRGAPFRFGRRPPSPTDLELRITTSADRKQFSFLLHSARRDVPYHWQPAGSVTLTDEPRVFLENTFKDLSLMARKGRDRRTEADDAQFRRGLTELGEYLYEQLFPDELKRHYRDRIRELRAGGIVFSILITSDEPWIPWELIKPYEVDLETGEEVFADDFLCARFQVCRWLAERGVPEAVRINTARLVAPTTNLQYVQKEREYFEQLPEHHPIEVLPSLNTVQEVLDALAGKATTLFHFACHGNFDYDDPDMSGLLLKDRQVLRPRQIGRQQQAGVARSKPLIFLNACHSGRIGFSLTRLGGWAESFVRAGASVFVGTLWEVNDDLAATFATRFYEALWEGQPLGEALHAARMQVRDLDDANPTWLAYTLYADPNSTYVSSSP